MTTHRRSPSEDRNALAAETHAYLAKTPNRDTYLDALDHKGVVDELVQRVLNARSWYYVLEDWGEVRDVVLRAARECKAARDGGKLASG